MKSLKDSFLFQTKLVVFHQEKKSLYKEKPIYFMSLSVKHSKAFAMSFPKRLLRWEDRLLYVIVSMVILVCYVCIGPISHYCRKTQFYFRRNPKIHSHFSDRKNQGCSFAFSLTCFGKLATRSTVPGPFC